MNTKKILLIVGIIVVSLSVIGTGFYFFKKPSPEPKNQKEIPDLQKQQEEKNDETTSSWQPKISTAEYYWEKELRYSDIDEKNIPEVIKAANNIISTKVGKEFFDKYIKYYPYQSSVSNSGTIFYLHYIVTIPEKNIVFKTTTHPTEIELIINKDLSLTKPEQITSLPDCKDINQCLKFVDRNKAINAVIADMEKNNYKAEEILLDYDFYSMKWHMRYDLPKEKLPNCEFKMGGNVSIYFDAFNNKVLKRQENCNFRGV
jgi:hypothetical protein